MTCPLGDSCMQSELTLSWLDILLLPYTTVLTSIYVMTIE